MMQRREASGRKAANRAMEVIAESIKASRGRKGKETPSLSRHESALNSGKLLPPKDMDANEMALIKGESLATENVASLIMDDASHSQASIHFDKENWEPQVRAGREGRGMRGASKQENASLDKGIPRHPLKEMADFGGPIVLSEKSNKAQGSASQPAMMKSLSTKVGATDFAVPNTLVPLSSLKGKVAQSDRERQSEDSHGQNVIQVKMGPHLKIFNDPEVANDPIFQKSTSMPLPSECENHPISDPQLTQSECHHKPTLACFNNAPLSFADEQKRVVLNQKRNQKLKDIKCSDQEVKRPNGASPTINIKNHMPNDPLPKPTTNQQSHETPADKSTQKLLDDLEYALSGTTARGLASATNPQVATPQQAPNGKKAGGTGPSSSSSGDDDDEEEMMADDGDDGNIMTQSVTGGATDGGLGGTGSGSQYQGRWTQEEHDKFIEGLQLFGKDWRRIEEYIGSRTCAQIRSHAQKYFNRLQRDIAKGIKRADESQLTFALGKKKKKQLLAQQAAAQSASVNKQTEEEKSSSSTIQGSVPYKQQRKDDKVFNTSTTPSSNKDISQPPAPAPQLTLEKQEVIVTPGLVSATVPMLQMQRVQDTLQKLAEDDLGSQMRALIAQREQISLEVLLQRLTRSMAGHQLVEITHSFHKLAMQALSHGKYEICNHLIDERNLTQFVCILLSRQITIYPPGTEQQYQAAALANGFPGLGVQASSIPLKEIVQRVDVSPGHLLQQRAAIAGRL